MYKRSIQSWVKHLDFILLDAISAQIALMLGYWIRFGFESKPIVYLDERYQAVAILLGGICVLYAVLFHTMNHVLRRSFGSEVRQTLTQCLLVFGTIIVLIYSIKGQDIISRIMLWSMLACYIVIAFVTRMLWKLFLRVSPITETRRVMLLITDEPSVEVTLEQIRAYPVENIEISGIVLLDRDAKGEKIDGIPVVANGEDAATYICREWIDDVFISVADHAATPDELLTKCEEMGVTTHLRLLSIEKREGKQIVEKLAGMQVLTSSINITSTWRLLLKRIIDIFGGLVLSFCAILIMLIVGPIIKRKSPGPILYKQERIGQNGRKFKMYKIRSMYADADARKQDLMDRNRIEGGLMFKLDFDPRIIGNEILPDGTKKTGIGEFIRRTSLDEFPQGFNVLMGQMSLVGTRPPTVDEWERYELHHRARLATKPGITGMWQVSGRSEITDFEEITKLDTQYIANWSLWLDLKILIKTFGTVMRRKGAM